MSISFGLRGHAALVTGGTSGLGAAIAEALARDGAHVCVTGRDILRGQSVASSLKRFGGDALFVQADVTETDDVTRSVNEAVEHFGALDILVNSAGVYRTKATLDMTDEDWDDTMATNLRGTFLYCREAAKVMATAGRGKIVNLASSSGYRAVGGEVAYCVSKAGVVHLTKVLAVEWIKKGIHVNAVAPCDFETPLIAASMADPNYSDWVARALPIGRIGQPPELVDAVMYLCSSASSMVVGHTLVVDGGRTLA